MRAAALIIGEEILSGRTRDANLPVLAEALGQRGIAIGEVRIVRDDIAQIGRAARELSAGHDHVFASGGIGPTHDDVTAQAMAQAWGVALELNAAARQRLLAYYGAESELTPPRLKMAMIPQGAALIDNPLTAAPGFRLGNVWVMAGVPSIFQAMLLGFVHELAGGPPILSASVKCGLREGQIADGLAAIAAQYPDLSIGSYPSFRLGALGLQLVARGTDRARLQAAAQAIAQLCRDQGEAQPTLEF